MTWAVCTHTARRQNARLPYPIRLRSLLVTISMKYPGLKELSSHSKNIPRVVGVVHSLDCLKIIQNSPEKFLHTIDLLEVRLDCLRFKQLPDTWPLPVIATARHGAEGGAHHLTLAERRYLLEEALPWSSAIDVELRSFKELASTLAHARKEKLFIISSFHDFDTVPSLARLESMALRAKESGADCFKVACRIKDEEGLLRLLAFQSMMSSCFPIAAMGMGEGGQLSRLLLAGLGSILGYGWLSKPQIKGQSWACEIQEQIKKFNFFLSKQE